MASGGVWKELSMWPMGWGISLPYCVMLAKVRTNDFGLPVWQPKGQEDRFTERPVRNLSHDEGYRKSGEGSQVLELGPRIERPVWIWSWLMLSGTGLCTWSFSVVGYLSSLCWAWLLSGSPPCRLSGVLALSGIFPHLQWHC